MKKPNTFSPELREPAVRLALACVLSKITQPILADR